MAELKNPADRFKARLLTFAPVSADGKLTVTLPDKAPDPIALVLCLETDAGIR